jgi:hypothetical protein
MPVRPRRQPNLRRVNKASKVSKANRVSKVNKASRTSATRRATKDRRADHEIPHTWAQWPFGFRAWPGLHGHERVLRRA